MSNNRLVFDGLAELRENLRNMPAELTGEAGHIVEGKGNEAAVTIRTAYGKHRRSGNLQDHVSVEQQATGPFGVAVVVKSTARHAELFEFGSQARHTSIGANRGSMPATPTFVPAVTRKRREMYEQLKGLLQREGLAVTGDAG